MIPSFLSIICVAFFSDTSVQLVCFSKDVFVEVAAKLKTLSILRGVKQEENHIANIPYVDKDLPGCDRIQSSQALLKKFLR